MPQSEQVEADGTSSELAAEDTPVSVEQAKEIDVNAEVISMLNGVLVGAATVLVIKSNSDNIKDQTLEDETVQYLKQYVGSLISQGVTRDGLGFLFSQMGVAAHGSNIVQNVAHYLLGLVLEESK